MASNTAHISILSIRAQKEITQSWEWYEERQQTLGDRFLIYATSLSETLLRKESGFIILNPLSCRFLLPNKLHQ